MKSILILISYFILISCSSLKSYERYVGLSNSTHPQSLKPNQELASGDQFGEAVAIWSDLCLVSATKRAVISSVSNIHADIDGIVYVFQRDDTTRNWKDTGVTLTSTVPQDGFGESLSLYKDTAAVGAPKDDTYGTNSGLVYVYYTTISSSGENIFGNYQTLHSEHQREYDYFGYSVAVVPGVSYYTYGTVVIGAYGHDWDGRMVDSGAVFVFANSGTTWYQVTMIQPSQPYMNGYFGWSISAYDNAVLVGAPGQESAFLFHLEGVRTECPHDIPPDQMPESCQQQQQQPHLRHLQGVPGQEPGHHTYSVWKYVEILHVQNPLDTNKGEKFGHSVAVINETILTVVIGAPYDNSLGTGAGSVVILSELPVNDIWESWTPGTPNNNPNNRAFSQINSHVKEDNIQNKDQLKENEILKENIYRNLQKQNQPEMNDPRMNIWKIRSSTYTTDKDGSYWMLFKKTYGRYQNERYGQSVGVSDNHIIVGTNPGSSRRGRAEILAFNTTTTRMTDRPIYKGPLYMKDWIKQGDLFDYYGSPGDYFGYIVGLHEETAIIGGFLTGYQSEWNIGTGGAFIYDAIQIIPTVDKSSSSSSSTTTSSLSSVNPLVRIGIYSIVIILIFVAIGGLFFTLSTNLPFFQNFKILEKDIDTSTSTIEIGDITSSHPLNSSSRESLPSHQRYRDDYNRKNSSNNNNNNNNNNVNNNNRYNSNNNNNNNNNNNIRYNNNNSSDEEGQYQPANRSRNPPVNPSTNYPDNSRRGRTSQYFSRNQQGQEQNQYPSGRTMTTSYNNNTNTNMNTNTNTNDNSNFNNNNNSNNKNDSNYPYNQQLNRLHSNPQPPPSKYSNLATSSSVITESNNPSPSPSPYVPQGSQPASRTRTFQY